MKSRRHLGWLAAALLGCAALPAQAQAPAGGTSEEWITRLAGLATAPERGRVVPELRWNGITTYRELVVPPWRVIYRIHETRVLVVSVVDSRRQLEDLLLARFLRS